MGADPVGGGTRESGPTSFGRGEVESPQCVYPPWRISFRMVSRRAVLAALGTGSLGGWLYKEVTDPDFGTAYAPSNPPEEEASEPTVTESSTPAYSKNFGVIFAAGFDRVEWSDRGRLIVYFADDHGMVAFALSHYLEEPLADALFVCQAPPSGGKKTVPFREVIADAGVTFPSRRFRLAALSGTVTTCGKDIPDATVQGSVTFRAPPSAMPDGSYEE